MASYDSRRSSGGGGGGGYRQSNQYSNSDRDGSSYVRTLRAPILGEGDDEKFVEIFPNELPADAEDSKELLRSELAPLESWLEWATEYYRQDQPDEFEDVLNFVIEKEGLKYLKEKLYDGREEECNKRLMDIYLALAAKKLKDVNTNNSDFAKECKKKMNSYIKLAEDIPRTSSNTKTHFPLIIKAFFELYNGDFKSAMSNFKSAYASGENETIQHISRVGIACVLYNQKDYLGAYKELSLALEQHPGCGAGIRIAIAVCTFHLKDYTTSKAALKRALELDPGNSNIYSLLALNELQDSRSVESKIAKDGHLCRSNEYSIIAVAFDKNNVVALNQVANNMLYSWKPYSFGCLVKSNTQLIIPLSHDFEIVANDVVRIGDCKQTLSVAEVVRVQSSFDKRVQEFVPFFDSSVSGFLIISLSQKTPISSDAMNKLRQGSPNALHELWAKDITGALDICKDVTNMTSNDSIKSEAYYITGKAHHLRRDFGVAKSYYELSIQNNDAMALAKFELARLAFSNNEMKKALEYCTQLLVLFPTDKDTNALVYLINSITADVVYPIETLTKTCSGSMYEFDLWLRQATLRQRDSGDRLNALKCYQNAAQCAIFCRRVVTVDISNNMIVLNHELGHNDIAFLLAKQTLKENRRGTSKSSSTTTYSSNFKNFEFEGIFYDWETLAFSVTARYNSDTFGVHLSIDSDGDADAMQGASSFDLFFKVGDEVVVSDMVFVVEQITSATEMVVKHRFRGLHVDSDNSGGSVFPIKRKLNYNNLNDSTLALVFNMARVMESVGKSEASFEAYSYIVNAQPTFVECYLRLSKICKDRGQNDKALDWLNQAMVFAAGNASMVEDIHACIGDLHFRGSKWEEAKRAYEKQYESSGKKDGRSMLCLGNIYFANLSSKPEFIKDSYKFFYHVANSDKNNLYAAHGLSMVVAEKGHLDAANSMFSKLRDDAPRNNDIQSNLGNVLLKQGRYRDAEGCYAPSLKSESNKLQSDKLNQRYECTVYCLIKRGEVAEALKVLLGQLHLDPTGSVRAWYNLVIVLQMLTKASIRSEDSKSVENSLQSMVFALRIVSLLNYEYVSLNCRKVFEREKLKQLKDSVAELNQKCNSEFSKLQAKKNEMKRIMEESKRNSLSNSSMVVDAPRPSASAAGLFVQSNNGPIAGTLNFTATATATATAATTTTAKSILSILGEDDDDDDDVKPDMALDGDADEDNLELELNMGSASKAAADGNGQEEDLDDIFAADADSGDEKQGGSKSAGHKRKPEDDGDNNGRKVVDSDVEDGDDAKKTSKKMKSKAVVVESDDDDIF